MFGIRFEKGEIAARHHRSVPAAEEEPYVRSVAYGLELVLQRLQITFYFQQEVRLFLIGRYVIPYCQPFRLVGCC
jgi:hypothetical protein